MTENLLTTQNTADTAVAIHDLGTPTAGQLGVLSTSAEASSPTPIIYGVDVSHYQAAIDWALALRLGKQFCSAKASDGLTDTCDSMFPQHRASSKAAGLLFSPYHFFRFDHDPIHQAEVFMKIAGDGRGELPPMIDIEWDNRSSNPKYRDGGEMDNHAADLAYAFKERVKQIAGRAPILYTSFYFFMGFDHPERFADCIPWIAAYHTTLEKVKTPKPWAKEVFWQYSDQEQLKGVKAIDGDVFNGSIDQLKAMVRK